MIRGTSAVLLLLNGLLSSQNAMTRAFLNQNIRGRQVPQKPLALWVGLLPEKDSTAVLGGLTGLLLAVLGPVGSGRQELCRHGTEGC